MVSSNNVFGKEERHTLQKMRLLPIRSEKNDFGGVSSLDKDLKRSGARGVKNDLA
jgi:hypothetical protein